MQLKNLSFHLTFPPVAEGISRLLAFAGDSTPMTKEELSQQTGIPTGKSSGKVLPYIQYGVYMGVLQDTVENTRHSLSRTPLGQEVYRQDPGLRERVTLLTLHTRLTSAHTGASLWAYMFKYIFPNYPDGISDALLKDALQQAAHTEVTRGPFISGYGGMFAPLQLLSQEGPRLTLSTQPYDPECLYAYAYGILYEWEAAFGERGEITGHELYSLQMATTLGMSAPVFEELLQKLGDRGILHFNRQLVPYTVVRTQTAADQIAQLYSLLC